MKTTAIYTNKRGTTLVKLEKDNKDIEWVVCSEYDEHAKEGRNGSGDITSIPLKKHAHT